jgi:hypothetical protein
VRSDKGSNCIFPSLFFCFIKDTDQSLKCIIFKTVYFKSYIFGVNFEGKFCKANTLLSLTFESL